jgi:hypothetical protein
VLEVNIRACEEERRRLLGREVGSHLPGFNDVVRRVEESLAGQLGGIHRHADDEYVEPQQRINVLRHLAEDATVAERAILCSPAEARAEPSENCFGETPIVIQIQRAWCLDERIQAISEGERGKREVGSRIISGKMERKTDRREAI